MCRRDSPVALPTTLTLALAYFAFVSLGLPDTLLGVAWPSLRATFGVSQAGLGALFAYAAVSFFWAQRQGHRPPHQKGTSGTED